MNKLHEKSLQSNRMYLGDWLDPDEVVTYLFQEDILDDNDMGEIKAEKTRRNKVYALLDRLRLCGPNAFDTFHWVFEENKSTFYCW